MAEEQQVYDPNADYLSDISVRLRDIEEKQNLIKDRVLLIGENLISEKDLIEQELQEMKSSINKSNDDIKRIKMAIERIVDDMGNLVRKNEFEILQRQFEMFKPLELARMSDVQEMINSALRKAK